MEMNVAQPPGVGDRARREVRGSADEQGQLVVGLVESGELVLEPFERRVVRRGHGGLLGSTPEPDQDTLECRRGHR